MASTIIPCLRYRDALHMVDWLCEAFGFEKQAVYADGDTVHHAQLTYGDGMIMLGSSGGDSEWGKLIADLEDTDHRETQSPCVIVADADAHYARAKAAGAESKPAGEKLRNNAQGFGESIWDGMKSVGRSLQKFFIGG